MTERLQRLLASLSSRERILVVIGLALGVVALFFIAVVDPLSAARSASAGRLADRLDLLEWLTARAVEARRLRDVSGDDRVDPAAGAAGIAGIEASLGARGLRPSLVRLAPRPDGRFDARFEDVSYTAFIAWLAESSRQSGVTVTRIVIEAAGRPDRVDAEFSATVSKGPPG